MTISNKIWVYVLGIAFILINSFVVFQYDLLLMAALPAVILLLLATFYHTDKVLLFTFFCAPLSLNLEDMGAFGVGMYLPTEPILFGLTILFVLDQLRRPSIGKGILWHPISISIYMYLIWLLFTSITSARPDVSFKFLLSRVWFFVPVLFYGAKVFADPDKRKQSLWLYLIPLTGVVLYTLVRHAGHGFAEDPGHWVMSPFYKDHTSYGAILALFTPIVVGFLSEKDLAFYKKFALWSILIVLIVGLYFSYTRAAWLSLVGGLGVYAILKYKVPFKLLVVVTAIAAVFAINEREKILLDLERNRSEHTTEDLGERLESVSNISTDASNLERINRWNSAISMYEKRPVVGYGPGTYAMEYAPHQDPKDMTIISSNYGDMGNAHSEYLGALAEAGLPGAILFTLIVVFVFLTGAKLYHALPIGEDKTMVMIIVVALSTYFAHSALNNYLDTDKAAVPVWGMVAILIAIQIKHGVKIIKLNRRTS